MTLPTGFESYFRSAWSDENVDRLIRGLSEEVPVSIRINPARMPADAWPEGGEARVPWCHEGIYLSERPQFTADPLLHAGAYYVQEASSMFIAHIVRCLVSQSSSFVSNALTALDLCAAPGGKSTLLRSLLPSDCSLVSNEPMRQRAQVLAENLAKWGAVNTIVTQAYADDLARLAAKDKAFEGFDLILADVPCSGEGMMRKEEAAVSQWSPEFVSNCAALQRSIVADIWSALRPGGFMIYSTCTFNPEEDEQNVEWITRELGADIIPIPADPAWGILGDPRIVAGASTSAIPNSSSFSLTPSPHPIHLPFCHFLPGRVRGEGFFCSLLRKHGETAGASKNAHFIDSIRRQPYAMPTDQLDGEAATRVDLSLDDAFRYLQREALTLPPGTPRGIVQAGYHGQRLGLMKNIGSRANNLYPKEWRIRSGFLKPQSLFYDD